MVDYKEYTIVFKALSDETRLKIVEMLSCNEMCACDILDYFQISQSTLSYHMKILTECNLICSRKDGSWVKYSLNDQVAKKIKIFWEDLTSGKDDCICNEVINKNKCK